MHIHLENLSQKIRCILIKIVGVDLWPLWMYAHVHTYVYARIHHPHKSKALGRETIIFANIRFSILWALFCLFFCLFCFSLSWEFKSGRWGGTSEASPPSHQEWGQHLPLLLSVYTPASYWVCCLPIPYYSWASHDWLPAPDNSKSWGFPDQSQWGRSWGPYDNWQVHHQWPKIGRKSAPLKRLLLCDW